MYSIVYFVLFHIWEISYSQILIRQFWDKSSVRRIPSIFLCTIQTFQHIFKVCVCTYISSEYIILNVKAFISCVFNVKCVSVPPIMHREMYVYRHFVRED